MQNDAMLLPEERVAGLSDELVQSIIKSDEISLQNRKYLFGQLPLSVFRNENYVICYVFYSFKDRNITPDSAFLQIYLQRNAKVFDDRYVNLSEFESLDEDPAVARVGTVLKQFNRLSTLKVLPHDEFRLTLEKYRTEFCSLEMNRVYSESKTILYDGITQNRKLLQGYADSITHVNKAVAMMSSVMDRSKGKGFIDSSSEALDDNDIRKPEKIGDFDLITELNEHLGGIYTGLFYSVVAPTKGGKSKFMTRMAHTMVVQYGVNISVWPFEGGYNAWWAQIRAVHYEYVYIRNKSDGEKYPPLSQMDILFGKYPSPEIRALEQASRLDLFTNPKYGKIAIIDQPLEVETYIDNIDTSVKLNNSRAVFIDYLQLIVSKSGLTKNEGISRAYQAGLAYCSTSNIAFISPAQFTQKFMNELTSKSSGDMEIRVAGGESSEVVRTPDINLALYATVEDIRRKEMTILSMPSRMCSPFPDIPLYADLCSCVFSSIQE